MGILWRYIHVGCRVKLTTRGAAQHTSYQVLKLSNNESTRTEAVIQ